MTHKHAVKSSQEPHSTAGLLLSLSHALPNPSGALGRSARLLAHRLSAGDAGLQDVAADMLARLLDATDETDPWDADLLDPDWDA